MFIVNDRAKELNISVNQLVELIGVSRAQVFNLLHGRKNYRFVAYGTLESLASVLQYDSVEKLIDDLVVDYDSYIQSGSSFHGLKDSMDLSQYSFDETDLYLESVANGEVF